MDYSPATPDYEPPTFEHRLAEDEDSGWVTPTHEFVCSPRREKSVAGRRSVSRRRRHDRLRNDRDEDDDSVASHDDEDEDDNDDDGDNDDELDGHNVSGEHVHEVEDENDAHCGDDVSSVADESRSHDVAERSVDCTDDSRLETDDRAEDAVPLNSPVANEDAVPATQQHPNFASPFATADDDDTVCVVDSEHVAEPCGASSRDCSDDSRVKQRRSAPKGANASGSPVRARNASRRSSTSSSASSSSTSSSTAVRSSFTAEAANVVAVTSPSRVVPTTVAMDAHESQQPALISATTNRSGAGQGKQARSSAAGSSAAATGNNSITANGGGSSNSRKRKLQAVNVNLLHFAHALWEAYLDACPQDRKGSKRYVTSKNLLSFLRYAPNNEDLVQHLDAIGVQQRPAKRAREYVPLVADTGAVAAARPCDAKALEQRSDDETCDETAHVDATIGEKSPDETKDTGKQSIMLQLTMRLMADIESAGIGYQFSREALKCFLATYSQILTPDDFGNARIAEAVMRGSGGAVSWQETSGTARRCGGDSSASSSSSSGRKTSSNGSRKPSPNSDPSKAKNGKRSSATTTAATAGAAAARRNNGRDSGSKPPSSSRSGRSGVGGASSSPAKATATAVAVATTTSSTGGGNERHNKSNAPLPPGGILLEYVKGISSFLANVNRSDPNDLDALCFILRHRITLNSGIYSSLFRMRVQDLTYDVDRQNRGHEAGYVRVPAVNFKRAVLLLGHSVVMQLEGHHFVVASGTVEKDVPSSEIPRARGDYVVFDVMLGTRNKILDVLECRLKGCDDNSKLPDNYLDRLRWIATRFPGLKCVTVAGAVGGSSSTPVVPTTQLDVDAGYVRKSIDDPRGTVFVYTKPPMTAACVGFSNKHVHLAFREQAQQPSTSPSPLGSTTIDTEPPRLVVKTKCAINGPATFAIGIASQQKRVRPDSQGRLFVSCNGTRYELLGADTETVRVFDEAIPVEFKDGSKLGGLSDYEISSVNEFKPPSALKDSAIAEAASVAQHDLKRFFAVYTQKYGCREFLAQIQEWNRNMVQPLDFSDYD